MECRCTQWYVIDCESSQQPSWTARKSCSGGLFAVLLPGGQMELVPEPDFVGGPVWHVFRYIHGGSLYLQT
jgi:hypothetical protein